MREQFNLKEVQREARMPDLWNSATTVVKEKGPNINTQRKS